MNFITRRENRKGLIIGALVGAMVLPLFLFMTCAGTVESDVVALCGRSLLAANVGLGIVTIPVIMMLGLLGGLVGAFIDQIYKPKR